MSVASERSSRTDGDALSRLSLGLISENASLSTVKRDMSIRPFDEMDRMMEHMRRSTFESLGDVRDSRGRPNTTLTVDRDGDAYVVLADLPGFEKSEIDLRLDDGMLTVDATHEVAETGDRGAMARSRRVHEFVHLPGNVDQEGIEATYRNGVLEIRLPAVDEDDSGLHIDVA